MFSSIFVFSILLITISARPSNETDVEEDGIKGKMQDGMTNVTVTEKNNILDDWFIIAKLNSERYLGNGLSKSQQAEIDPKGILFMHQIQNGVEEVNAMKERISREIFGFAVFHGSCMRNLHRIEQNKKNGSQDRAIFYMQAAKLWCKHSMDSLIEATKMNEELAKFKKEKVDYYAEQFERAVKEFTKDLDMADYYADEKMLQSVNEFAKNETAVNEFMKGVADMRKFMKGSE